MIRENDSSQPVASIVTFDSTGRHPLHVLQVVAQWDDAGCLELAGKLAGLPCANRISDANPTTIQWAGLACYHTHHGDPQEPPWFELDGRPSLSDKIEAAIRLKFGKKSSGSDAAVESDIETFAFDRFGKPPYGNGALTVALIEFSAASEKPMPSPR
jgi:hypothetical protein